MFDDFISREINALSSVMADTTSVGPIASAILPVSYSTTEA